jgi:hypothetical protein
MSPRERYIRTRAAQLGLDPDAVAAIGSVEGQAALHGGTSIGDHGTSFGPFQLHVGGALPQGKDSAWAHSSAGIDYALRQMAKVAGGLKGRAAVSAISSRFERPADVPGEIAKAMGYYGGGAGRTSVFPTTGGTGAPQLASPSAGLSADAVRSMTAAYMLQSSAATAAGEAPSSAGLVALAIARRQAQAAQSVYGAQGASGGLTGPISTPSQTPSRGTAIPVEGQIGHLDPKFLSELTTAARARGAVKIVATSGERDPQHNAAVGGASHSNHLPDPSGRGHALDGFAVMQDGTRVPLGQFLLPNAGKYGLRSGATFQWGGKPDVVHVDDGFNQR